MADQHPRDVSITDVRTTRIDGNFTWTLVRLYTDAGVAGTGEAYWGEGVTELIEHRLADVVVGEPAVDIDRLVTEMYRAVSGQGSIGGTAVTAVSGVDLALHDLAGKVLEVPAYQLLGGKYRDEVRVYCDGHDGVTETGDPDPHTPSAYARAAEELLKEGWDAIKFDLDASRRHERDDWNRHLNGEAIDHKVRIVEAVIEAVDGRADVAFDCHWRWSGDSTRRLANAIAELDVWWLEDPVPPENHDVQRTVTAATDTTIAAGENVYRKHGVRRLIEEEAVDVIQPDMPKVGGMRETQKIGDLAETYYIPMALHNVSSPIGTMAGAHVAAAAPNFLALEYHARDLSWWRDLIEEPILADGRIAVPDAPGLGVTLDRDVAAEHLLEDESLFDPV